MRGSDPAPGPGPSDADLPAEFSGKLSSHGISRRRFLHYCAGLTAVLALPPRMTTEVAHGLAAAAVAGRPRVIWLAFQDCAGCAESFLRSEDPDVASLVFGMISLDYIEILMAAAGAQAEAARRAAMAKPGYLLIVEGSIPQGDIAGACTIGGRSAADLLAEAAGKAGAIVAVGTCASFGGIPAARPNPTGAVGTSDLVSGVPLVNGRAACQTGTTSARRSRTGCRSAACRPLMSWAGPCSPTATAFTITVTGGPSLTRASSRWISVMRATPMGGACTSWAAKVPAPSTTARRCGGTSTRAGRWRRVTAVWAARSRISGTP